MPVNSHTQGPMAHLSDYEYHTKYAQTVARRNVANARLQRFRRQQGQSPAFDHIHFLYDETLDNAETCQVLTRYVCAHDDHFG
ncbi:hypothetical protein ABC733_07475 [Mangrovibacter sp. SLW1]